MPDGGSRRESYCALQGLPEQLRKADQHAVGGVDALHEGTPRCT